jgi:hypothetical protein
MLERQLCLMSARRWARSFAKEQKPCQLSGNGIIVLYQALSSFVDSSSPEARPTNGHPA